MFSFLQSYFLYALAAVGLPFLIHLLNRRKAKRVPFSTIYFLKQLQQKKMRKLKLRQLLLLILRALIVGMFVLAFSRPTMKSQSFVLGEANVRTAAALVLDNSMSMQWEGTQGVRYTRALQAIKQVLQQLKPGDQISLFLSCPTADYSVPQNFASVATVDKLLQETQASQQYGNLLVTVMQAQAELNRSIFPNKELYVFSDFQNSSWQIPSLNRPKETNAEIRTFLIDVGDDNAENCGIQQTRLQNQIIELRKTVTLTAAVTNYGDEAVQDLMLNAFLQEKRVGQNSVDLSAGRSEEINFNLLIKEPGFISGMIELADDPLLADNRGYFVFYLHDKIPILLLGDPPDLNYLQLALAPNLERQQLFSFVQADHLQSQSFQLAQFPLIALADPDRLTAAETAALVQYLKAGGHLLFFPGNHTDLRWVNEQLLKPLGAPLIRETRGTLGNSSAYSRWGAIDWRHPIFTGVFRDKVEDIDSPHFYFRLDLEANAPAGTDIIKYSDGLPFLQAVSVDKGSILLFTTALDPAWSDFIYKPIFPPLVYRAVIYLASQSQQNTAAAILGDELQCEVFEPDANYILLRPDGVSEKVVAEHVGASLRIKAANVRLPGIYSLQMNDQILKQWAVNIDSRESNLERLPPKKVKEWFNNQAFELTTTAGFASQIQKYRFGSEVTRWFFLAALLLMALEMVIAREDLLRSVAWLRRFFREDVTP